MNKVQKASSFNMILYLHEVQYQMNGRSSNQMDS
jgi:hypothetical protein